MNEKKKHKIMLGIEVVLLCMIVAILGTNAASSNPPSNGVSYGKNNQDTVEGALNDLYDKANYGNASAGSILSGHTALVGGNRVTGTMPDRTNNTGTLGLAWSTSDYQMMGTQLRIGVSPGYYGTNNYWTWGTSGIVFDNYQEKLGITADKIVKGKSIAGVSGTGETGYSSCSSCCPTLASQTSATATAGDILSGKTAYVNGSKITGSMSNKGAVNATIAPGGTYTIPAGYHNGSGKVTASGVNIVSTASFSSSAVSSFTAEVGAYYVMMKGPSNNAANNSTFSGCTVIAKKYVEMSRKFEDGDHARAMVVIVKATSSTISVSNGGSAGWYWVKISS